jgi:DNA (cytosine-5)-methyltransferase 1
MDNWPSWAGQQWPKTEPLICRVDDGIPDRVGRTAACGNAVVPQIPEMIGRAILEAEKASQHSANVV